MIYLAIDNKEKKEIMLKIIEVTDKKLMKKFVDFVLDLYEGCPYYVPYLYGDEMNMLNHKFNLTLKDCEAKFYLCEKDNKIVGRIGAVLQKKYNERTGKKNVRFTRFDCVNDLEVAKTLLNTVEEFAKKLGMDSVMGPYGFNETDRSGYLTEGFEINANFGTNYNYKYYDELLKKCGYDNGDEWVELQLKPKEEALEKFTRLAKYAMKKFDLKITEEKNFKNFAKKYGWKAFQCLNAAYTNLPGFVPFEKDLYEQIRVQYSIALKSRYMTAVIDKYDEVVGFAVCFPSMAEAMKKTKGKLFPFGFIKVLNSIRKPEILELCLIGVRNEYMDKGANIILISHILKTIKDENIKITEAYPQLVDNNKSLSQWKHFDTEIIKRRRVVNKIL